MDCIYSELKEVVDRSLIQYVSESIPKGEICSVYQSFCEQGECGSNVEKVSSLDEHDTDLHIEREECKDSLMAPLRISRQKEMLQGKLPVALDPMLDTPNLENPFILNLEKEAFKEIIEFWDANGFVISNLNAKQQLLAWVDDSTFIQPKQVILKAMNIACANNKRKLSYIIGILKNWENESLLTVEEIDAYQEYPKTVHRQKHSTES
jgi:DnaD/phage-associated family protein